MGVKFVTDRELLEVILSELKSVKDEVKSNSTEIKSLKDEVELNSTEIKSLKDKVELNSTELKSVKDEIKTIRMQQQEDHLILKALEHSAQINKAEHDSMMNDIVHIQGYVKNIDENINAMKEIIGRHEVDLKVLKNRPV